MSTFLAFAAVLGPLILVHELGHFIGAKLTGVRVEEFGIGWPPKIFKFWQNPGFLMVGGVKIVAPSNFKLPKRLAVGQSVQALAEKERGKKYVLQDLRVLDTLSEPVETKQVLTDQGEVRVQGKLTDLEMGTEYTLNLIPVGGFCRMTGEEDPSDPRSLAAQPKRQRFLVLFAGAAMNLLLAILLFAVSFMSGFPEPTQSWVLVRSVLPDSPAAKAGIQADDIVLEADGVPVKGVGHLIEHIDAHAGETIELTLRRDDKELQLPVHVREVRTDEGRVGIKISNRGYEFVIRRHPPLEALKMGVEQFWYSMVDMVQLPALLVRGVVSVEEVKPVGPVGISQMAGEAIERSDEQNSWFTVLYFAGAISLAIGFTNLLPLPALDGGRILFVLLEALRGRRIDPAKEGLVHLVGLALLLGLMLLLTIQELMTPVVAPF